MSNAANDVHRPPLHGCAAAMNAARGTDRLTWHHFNTLPAYMVHITMNSVTYSADDWVKSLATDHPVLRLWCDCCCRTPGHCRSVLLVGTDRLNWPQHRRLQCQRQSFYVFFKFLFNITLHLHRCYCFYHLWFCWNCCWIHSSQTVLVL